MSDGLDTFGRSPAAAPWPQPSYGPVARWFAERFFEPVRFADSSVETLRALGARGLVVLVMPTSGWLSLSYVAWAMVRHALAPVRAVAVGRSWWPSPYTDAAQRGDHRARFAFAERTGGSALVFLRQPAFGSRRGREPAKDPLPALVEFARSASRPVYLVPTILLWERRQRRLVPGLSDRLFGSPQAPGLLHALAVMARSSRRAQLRLGEALELGPLAGAPSVPAADAARRLRGRLSRDLVRESRAVLGPPVKSAARLLAETLRDPVLQGTLAEVAVASARPVAAVEREAARHLEAIAARPSTTVLALAAPVLDWVFNRIYDGIDVDERGLERALRASAGAPLVLTPSHKSHVDYLLLSWVLYERGYRPPLVAAGANLSFFPLGGFLRRAGAFFLRRSFKGDPVYTAAFRAYLKKLVRERQHHEFFPEGGRSRTGKLLAPKLGLFSWLVDAVLEGASDELVFVPVAIDYERVVEGASYTAELQGAAKRAEDVRSLLAAPMVLTRRYGRISVGFDEPVSLRRLLAERGLDGAPPPSEEQKRALVRALAHRVMYGISRASTVTPHALLAAALLAHRRRGLDEREIVDRIQLLRAIAAAVGAPLSRALEDAPSSPIVMGPVHDAMRSFASEGFVRIVPARDGPIFQLEDEARPQLAYAKNSLVNLVAGRSIVASALLRTLRDGTAELPAVRDAARFASHLFKFELVYPAGHRFERLFEENVEHLVALGLVVRAGHGLAPAPGDHGAPLLQFLGDLMRDLFESYALAVLEAQGIGPAGSERKSCVSRALDRGRVAYHAGRLATAEALSKTSLENAFQALVDLGYLADEDRLLRPGARPLADALAHLRPFVPELR